MYQALYRSFRPEVFDSLIGQEHIVKILENQIKTQTTGHAYLFCGTRGTGKTTTARLLAKALNCTDPKDGLPCGECEACKAIAAGNFIDVIELDAASNNSVEDIRDIRESVNYPPAMGKKKVYILDEAHMLTGAAANALLKTLEEPPEHTVFVLATTEPEKLPATILSRSLRLDFRRVSEEKLFKHFKNICDKMGVAAEDDALRLLASNADGSVRDGLSLLDRCISGQKTLSRDDVLFLLGMTGTKACLEITDAILDGDAGKALVVLNELLMNGKEVNQFTRDLLDHFRNILLIRYLEHPENVLNLSIENIEKLKVQAKKASLRDLDKCIKLLSEAIQNARWSPRPRIPVELALVEMARRENG
ncbi:MAG: DNA polymerase III subunit gamma/tau [Bacillota bacterium]|nr:DNA polymerase III subunit gamma/tau [Bacillota bacterium]